jgi:D-aspartate ligase
VHVVSSDPDARVRWSRYCASFTVAAAGDDAARFAALERVIERTHADVVLPVCETGVRLLQARGDELRDRVALAPHEGTLEIGDKWRLAEMLRDAGLPHPATHLCTADHAWRRDLGTFPVLIKPRQMSGGFGIREFADPDSLGEFLAAHPELDGRCVVQAKIPGRDMGSSVLCRDGVVLAQTVQRPVRGAAHGFRTATEIEMVDHPDAARLVRRLFETLGWSGVANVDLRVDERDGSLSILEVNTRYWSSLLASHAAGVNFPQLACLAALGERFAPPRQRAQRFVQARSALRAWSGRARRGAAPAMHETMWPYLVADPGPRLMRLWRRVRPVRGSSARDLRAEIEPVVAGAPLARPAPVVR